MDIVFVRDDQSALTPVSGLCGADLENHGSRPNRAADLLGTAADPVLAAATSQSRPAARATRTYRSAYNHALGAGHRDATARQRAIASRRQFPPTPVRTSHT